MQADHLKNTSQTPFGFAMVSDAFSRSSTATVAPRALPYTKVSQPKPQPKQPWFAPSPKDFKAYIDKVKTDSDMLKELQRHAVQELIMAIPNTGN